MAKKKTAQPVETDAEPSFEEAMERIEGIVEAMESDSLNLEDMLGNYEEGSRLLRECQKRIDSAQKRIEMIAAAREDGVATLKEFQGQGEPAPAARPKPAPKPAPAPETGEEDEIRLF